MGRKFQKKTRKQKLHKEEKETQHEETTKQEGKWIRKKKKKPTILWESTSLSWITGITTTTILRSFQARLITEVMKQK